MRVVVLTGAGISAESGIPTFRGEDGLWEGHRVEDVATPEGYAADPEAVQLFYDARRAALDDVVPNAAHEALAALAAAPGVELTLVTQNIDDLHERGGSPAVIHMHGQLRSALCAACGLRTPWAGPLAGRPACPACGERALRPDVVWFGEIPYRMDEITEALEQADVFAAVGTSGEVYPAAGFVDWARTVGAETVELNAARTSGTGLFDEALVGPASVTVPTWAASVAERAR